MSGEAPGAADGAPAAYGEVDVIKWMIGVVILARKPLTSGVKLVAGVASPASKIGAAARIAKKVSS